MSFSLLTSIEVEDLIMIMGTDRFINTIKYIKMAASSNFGNVFSVLGKWF